MKRRNLPLLAALLLGAAACGPAKLVVTAEIEMDNPEGEGMVTQSLENLQIQLLPYDRDLVFDSLRQAYGTPEPEIPQSLLDARDSVTAAGLQWQEAERRWNSLRDTLQKIRTAMDQYSRGQSEYNALFREFQQFDAQLSRVESESKRRFDEFTALQQATLHTSDSLRAIQEAWSAEAYANADGVFAAKLLDAGFEAGLVADTTNAQGVASNFSVKPGHYWVFARFDLPFTELYWNVPVELKRGDPLQLRLTRQNAQERVKL